MPEVSERDYKRLQRMKEDRENDGRAVFKWDAGSGKVLGFSGIPGVTRAYANFGKLKKKEMRQVTFLVDNYGNLCRFVRTESCYFWYPAVSKKIYDLFKSWGNYDEWGGIKQIENKKYNLLLCIVVGNIPAPILFYI